MDECSSFRSFGFNISLTRDTSPVVSGKAGVESLVLKSGGIDLEVSIDLWIFTVISRNRESWNAIQGDSFRGFAESIFQAHFTRLGPQEELRSFGSALGKLDQSSVDVRLTNIF